VKALVAGLLVAATVFITVALATSGDDEPKRSTTAAPASGATLFASMGCGSCHTLAAANATGDVGPSLDERLPNHTRASLRAAILNPPRNGMMPTNFGARMTPAELDALVSYLLAAR